MQPEKSLLNVRRSILVNAPATNVWHMFETFDAMNQWWGVIEGDPVAGSSQGQWLDEYEPRKGGRIRMAVDWDGTRTCYGGEILVFETARDLTFDNDWIPNRGWIAPTYITLRLSPALKGTLVELFHHGLERTGGDVAATHAGYEQGWGMTQLNALKRLCEETS